MEKELSRKINATSVNTEDRGLRHEINKAKDTIQKALADGTLKID